jgi:nicotinate-nucleotide adenylyltransferase
MTPTNDSVSGEPTLRWLCRARAGIAKSSQGEPRLGVLSGTFNPPTRGHLALAERAAEELRLDEVLFVLPETPPHKQQLEASLDERAEMLLLAVSGQPKFSAAISTHGLFLDIHHAVAPHYPAATRIFFLAGRDAAERILLRWRYANMEQAFAEMFALFELAVAERGGRLLVPRDSPAARYATQIHPVPMPADYQKLSATLARERAGRGELIEDIVPEKVASYIARRRLYQG